MRRFLRLAALALVLPALAFSQSSGPSTPLQISGNLRILTLEGTPYEMGLAHGRTLRQEIREIVDRWKKDLAASYKTEAAAFIKAFLARTNFTTAIKKWTPGLLDEVRGIADGAELDFETVFAYQLIDETWVVGPELGLAKCTSIGARKRGSSPAFVSQTLDIPKFYHGFQTVLRIRDRAARLESLVLTVPGIIATNGLNSRGVGVCVNAVTQLAYAADGLPVDFIIRGILARKTLDEAERFLKEIKAAAPQNYVLGGPDRVVDVEVSAGNAVSFVPFDGAEFVYHTNTPMANDDFNPRFLERLKFRGRTVGQMKASCPRFNFLKTALADNSAPLDLDAAKSFYKNRESGINNSGTYACTIMVLKDEPELHIAPGRPDVEPFQVLRFK
jgi:isopenicillin-N N-acyltransferase-like protein